MYLEKAKGIIFGLAIGDALGHQTEFMTLSQTKQRDGDVGEGFHTRYDPPNILYSHANKKRVECN